MSIFYKIDRINKSNFHKSICLKNTVDRIENNNAHFNKITDSISGDGETKKIKNEGDTKSVPFEGVKERDSIEGAQFFQNHQDEHLTSKETACYCSISHSSAKKICMRWYLKNRINHTNNKYEFTRKIIADELKKIEGFLDQKYHNFILVVRHIQGDRKGVTPSKETNEISK